MRISKSLVLGVAIVVVAMARADSAPPTDAASAEQYRMTVGKTAREMFPPVRGWPDQYMYDQQTATSPRVLEGYVVRKDHRDEGSKVPYVLFEPEQFVGSAVLWLHGTDKSPLSDLESNPDRIKPNAFAKRLLDDDNAVVVISLSQDRAAKESKLPVDRSSIANRVGTTLSTIAVALSVSSSLQIVATGDAGPILLLATPFLEDLPASQKSRITHIVADARGTGLEKTVKPEGLLNLRNAKEYGGLLGMAALAAPFKLTIGGLEGIPEQELETLKEMYRVTNNQKQLRLIPSALDTDEVVQMLLEKK